MNILEALSAQRRGRFLVEAQSDLQEVVKAVLATGKAGKLSIKLKISPAEDGTVIISDDISKSTPRPSQSASVFYADDHGALFRDDPKQPEFPEVSNILDAQKTAAS